MQDILDINKIDELPEAERAPFYLSVQIPEKEYLCKWWYSNNADNTHEQNWQYLLKKTFLFSKHLPG